MALGKEVTVKSLFTGIQNAKVRVGSNYLRPGHYIVLVRNIKGDTNRKKEAYVAIELTIMRAYPDPLALRPHSVGENVTHMLMQKHDSFLGNVKQFCAVSLGMKQEDISDEVAGAVLGDDNPLGLTALEVKAKNTTTKRNTDFTQVDYMRTIPYVEVKAMLDPVQQGIFFPGGLLDKLVSAEADAAAQANAEATQAQAQAA